MIKKLISSMFLSAALSLGSLAITPAIVSAETNSSDVYMVAAKKDKMSDKDEKSDKMEKKEKKAKKDKMEAKEPKMAKDAKNINVNTASETQLEKINGIGDSLAKAIIKYRTANGKFKSIDDLAKVKGIGPKVAEKIKSQIVFK